MPEIYYSKKTTNEFFIVLAIFGSIFLIIFVPLIFEIFKSFQESDNATQKSSNFSNLVFMIIPLLIIFLPAFLIFKNFMNFNTGFSITSESVLLSSGNQKVNIPISEVSDIQIKERISYGRRSKSITYSLLIFTRNSNSQQPYYVYSLNFLDVLEIATNLKIHDLIIANNIKTNIYDYLMSQINQDYKNVRTARFLLVIFFSLFFLLFILNYLLSLSVFFIIFLIPIVYFIYSEIKGLHLLNKFEQMKDYLRVT